MAVCVALGAFRLIYCSSTVQKLAANIISKLAGISEMSKSKGLEIIENLRTSFENRSHQRDGALKYLIEIYKAIRKRPWIKDDVDQELEREPRTSNLFAHLIEVTSDFTPKMRSKYAHVLQIAQEQNVHSTKFEVFIKTQGGFNEIIEQHMAKRRKFAPLGQWQ
jgi:hypothetical protein